MIDCQASLLAPPAVKLFHATDEERDKLKKEIAGLRVVIERQAAIVRQQEVQLLEEQGVTQSLTTSATVQEESDGQAWTTQNEVKELKSQVGMLKRSTVRLECSLHEAKARLESHQAEFDERLEAHTLDVERRYTHTSLGQLQFFHRRALKAQSRGGAVLLRVIMEKSISQELTRLLSFWFNQTKSKQQALDVSNGNHSVRVEITLEMDFNRIGGAGTKQRRQFEEQLVIDIAVTLRIPPTAIRVNKLEAGSVTASLDIIHVAGVSETPTAIRNRLLLAVKTKDGPLYGRPLTRFVDPMRSANSIVAGIVAEAQGQYSVERSALDLQYQLLSKEEELHKRLTTSQNDLHAQRDLTAQCQRDADAKGAMLNQEWKSKLLQLQEQHNHAAAEWAKQPLDRMQEAQDQKHSPRKMEGLCREIKGLESALTAERASTNLKDRQVDDLHRQLKAVAAQAEAKPKTDDIIRVVIGQVKRTSALRRMLDLYHCRRTLDVSRLVSQWNLNQNQWNQIIARKTRNNEFQALKDRQQREDCARDDAAKKSEGEIRGMRQSLQDQETRILQLTKEWKQKLDEQKQAHSTQLVDAEVEFSKKLHNAEATEKHLREKIEQLLEQVSTLEKIDYQKEATSNTANGSVEVQTAVQLEVKLNEALEQKQRYQDKWNVSAAEVSDLKATRDELKARIRQMEKAGTV